MRHSLLALSLLLSAACFLPQRATGGDAPSREQPTVERERATRKRPFVSLEYDAYRVNGSGAISGQAFLRTRGGDVKFGAGSVVHLVPVTSYSFEWYNRQVLGDELLEERDARAEFFHWTERADGFGEFLFEDLPAGEYFVAAEVSWEIQAANGEFHSAGGWAHARVQVREERTTRAVLTR